jgi:hypothetical protein
MASAVGLTVYWLSIPFMLQDTLQDKWSPCHNICTVLMSIQSMLTDPNCSSPANPEAAQLYTKDRTAYNRCVYTWAAAFIVVCEFVMHGRNCGVGCAVPVGSGA